MDYSEVRVSGVQFHLGHFGDQHIACIEILHLREQYYRGMPNTVALLSTIDLAINQQPMDLSGPTDC